jgi:glutathione synthase/RimK-type ligase-like ATP-grasp enzyme
LPAQENAEDLKLNFGAFDLIKDETETYYFIEVNSNGQYFWIELLTGAPLTDAMASLIVRLSKISEYKSQEIDAAN